MKELQLTNGTFALVDDEDEAAKAYNIAATNLYGEFAVLNKV